MSRLLLDFARVKCSIENTKGSLRGWNYPIDKIRLFKFSKEF